MLAKQYVFMVKKMRKKVMTAIALLPIFALPVFAVINRIYSWNATYYFAIALPQNMGEPLEKLEISQTEGFDKVDFYSNQTIAYLQSPSGDRVAISSKTELLPSQDSNRPKITITFNPPIPASNELNTKLVVGLRPA